ncbi:hydroxymethylbilane synthase [Hyphomicrobium sp.]|uniref:hydroxymethylbilane synthase n=1 Tax=Hyphomicrobium sp. TaxID=82 RepID=UPI000FA68B6C|nr:hydroxymethylbilane synthase [Hyphomicrobium sp.]RUP08902.1 MAG: hydroxymethylbilane synthase [Hyphomicrobium sp.]
MQATRIRIGTRGSPLALAQAHEVKARLMAAHGLPESAISVNVIKTTGDRVLDRPLADVGGKGLFTKEIEDALIANEVDVGVHSMKDMQTVLPGGLAVGAVLPREDPRDAFISLRHADFNALPLNAVVGTSSLRRKSQVLNARPDLRVVEFRGNVQTRLRKLEEGVAEATFLAVAGLKRLGMQDRITAPVSIEHMLPAVAQGVIALEIREGDEATAALIRPLNDPETAVAATAERTFLARMEGSCRTPIAGYAVINAGELLFRGQILSVDGSRSYDVSRSGPPENAAELGLAAADEILTKADPAILLRSNA